MEVFLAQHSLYVVGTVIIVLIGCLVGVTRAFLREKDLRFIADGKYLQAKIENEYMEDNVRNALISDYDHREEQIKKLEKQRDEQLRELEQERATWDAEKETRKTMAFAQLKTELRQEFEREFRKKKDALIEEAEEKYRLKVPVSCSHCDGNGKIIIKSYKYCENCEGEGFIHKLRTGFDPVQDEPKDKGLEQEGGKDSRAASF